MHWNEDQINWEIVKDYRKYGKANRKNKENWWVRVQTGLKIIITINKKQTNRWTPQKQQLTKKHAKFWW